jgi:hypothetical protein
MPEPTVHGDGELRHPSVRYERSDVSFRGIMIVLAAVIFAFFLIFAGVLIFFDLNQSHENKVKKSRFPLAPGPNTALPAEPRLEQIDRLEGVQKANVYAREESKLKILDSYGETEESGYVHIPIDKAIELLADKLPARKPPSEAQQRRSNGLIDSGAPNSGRLFRGGKQ